MAIVPIDLGRRSYEVRIGPALIDNLGAEAEAFLRKRVVPVVSDANVHALWGKRVERALADAGHEAAWHVVSPGEGAKSWRGLETLTDWLLDQGVERGDHVIALGGGVVGDLTGFACAILKRGCGFVQVPTTLLAQVDSSVGGKTAINTRAGKNLIGAFHQPSLVLADTAALDTLPDREMRAGVAEVIKYGVLGDAQFFDWLNENALAMLSRDAAALDYGIARSVEAKARIVAADERETKDMRALLNLGHTFGHALEAETGFSDTLLHGEAVALGMVLAARYSARIERISIDAAQRVTQLIDRSGLPSEIAALDLSCDGARLVDHMRHDKKMDAGTLPFVLLEAIGSACVVRDVELKDVAAFLDEELVSH
jgi:3-dehydroquinate synthase